MSQLVKSVIVLLTILIGIIFANSFEFASYYTSNMVLQANENTYIWGYTPNAVPAVTLDGSPMTVFASSTGQFAFIVPPTQANFTFHEITATLSGFNPIHLTGILFGEVWICSGQSNMAFSVEDALNSTDELQAANNFPYIRYFKPFLQKTSDPQIDYSHRVLWQLVNNITISGFSAVCWFGGRDLFQQLHVPIGLMDISVGGTSITEWSPPNAISKCAWNKNNDSNSDLWNGMIYPLTSMTIQGFWWYQGESDVAFPIEYSCALPTFIQSCRDTWESDLWFGIVQLCGEDCQNSSICPQTNMNTHWTWAYMRFVQYNAAYTSNRTFVIITLDLSMSNATIALEATEHSPNKQPVGQRLAWATINQVYGHLQPWQGPVPLNNGCCTSFENGSIIFIYYSESLSFIDTKNAFNIGYEVQTTDGLWHLPTNVSVSDRIVILEYFSQLIGWRYAYRNNPCVSVQNDGSVIPSPCQIYDIHGLPSPPWISGPLTC